MCDVDENKIGRSVGHSAHGDFLPSLSSSPHCDFVRPVQLTGASSSTFALSFTSLRLELDLQTAKICQLPGGGQDDEAIAMAAGLYIWSLADDANYLP
jgi:hypothetical protein